MKDNGEDSFRSPSGCQGNGSIEEPAKRVGKKFVTPLLHHSMSSDYLVRPREHVRRNRQADLLGRLQINDELELRRLFHRKISGFGAFNIFVYENSREHRMSLHGKMSPVILLV